MELDPEMVRAVMSLSEEDPDATKLRRQQAMIDQMRQSSSSQGGHMAGRVYSAPGIANVAADLFSGYAANKMQPGVDAGMAQMGQKRTSSRAGYMEALIKAMRRGVQPGTNPGMDMGTGMGEYPSTPQAGF